MKRKGAFLVRSLEGFPSFLDVFGEFISASHHPQNKLKQYTQFTSLVTQRMDKLHIHFLKIHSIFIGMDVLEMKFENVCIESEVSNSGNNISTDNKENHSSVQVGSFIAKRLFNVNLLISHTTNITI